MNIKKLNPKLIIPNNNGGLYNLGIVVPHRPVFDYLSFLCWFSFASNYDLLKTVLFFTGRPDDSFHTWGTKMGCKIVFLNNFENLNIIENNYRNLFEYPYFICMYNVFLVYEEEKSFEKSFESQDFIFRKKEDDQFDKVEIIDCSHNKLIPIVKFNFADENLIANSMININAKRKLFLAEKHKNIEESVNEAKLDKLHRKSHKLYRLMVGGYNGQ